MNNVGISYYILLQITIVHFSNSFIIHYSSFIFHRIEVVFSERLIVFMQHRSQFLSYISPMPSFGHLPVDFCSFLVRIMKSKSMSIGFEPLVIFVGLSRIKRISLASSRNYLDIHSQPCLMFARSYFCASNQCTSLFDEISL